jgi:hypothetical protein
MAHNYENGLCTRCGTVQVTSGYAAPAKIVVLSGRGSMATESSANEMRQPGLDVLVCREASDVKRKLERYGESASVNLMLMYDFPSGRTSRSWLHSYMLEVERQVGMRSISSRPSITIVESSDGCYLRCPWDCVPIKDVVMLVDALDAALLRC